MASILRSLRDNFLPPTADNMTLPEMTKPLHPYYPVESEVVGYLANDMSTLELLGAFNAGCMAIFAMTYLVVKRTRPQISTSDLLTVLWFVMCGCIHLFFEGYYVYNFRSMGPLDDVFGQLWKEYSLSDSRYLTKNAFVLCMETITCVCWGPLSLITASFIARDHPLRYPFQLIVSLGQLYGDVLYYATSLFDHWILNLSYSRPEAFYFWGYFVFMNAFWIVIPFWLLCNSVGASWRAFSALEKFEKTLKKRQ